MDHKRYFRAAYEQALFSPDTSTQTGAVIVCDGQIVGAGCNDIPLGVQRKQERLVRPMKYDYVEHAERNALFDFASKNTGVNKPIEMYALWAACADCARAIICMGVDTVHTHAFYLGDTGKGRNRKDWNNSISSSMSMFAEANVKVVFHEFQIMEPGESILFNERLVSY